MGGMIFIGLSMTRLDLLEKRNEQGDGRLKKTSTGGGVPRKRRHQTQFVECHKLDS